MEFTELEERMMKALLVGHEQSKQVPSTSGIYTAWLEGESRCLYVGRAGNSASGNLSKRLRSHFSGQRGGDQFCLYVYDNYIHELRCRTDKRMSTKQVNKRTGNWIKERVKFRWVEMSEQEARWAERELRRKWSPILNPL